MYISYIYKYLSILFYPAILLYLRYRLSKGQEDANRISERLGQTSFPRPDGRVIWFHAASIGEAMSVVNLIEKIQEQYKDINIIFTTGTVTSSKMVNKKFPKKIIHQFVPVDSHICISRFIKYWQPDLAIWVESEIWPNMVNVTKESGCPILLINGRISAKSARHWKYIRSFAKDIFRKISLFVVQTEKDRVRFRGCGAKNVIIEDNLKFDAKTLPSDPLETGKLVSQIGDRVLWVAASTNKGEEESIIHAHQLIAQDFPNLLTIIIPRHPNRTDEIVKICDSKSFEYSLRSKGDEITEKTHIYIADTIGEIGIFYRLSEIVFIGGSLVNHGGQNPLEAARLKCAILAGYHTHNFNKIYDEMEKAEAYIKVFDSEELAKKVTEILHNHDIQERYAEKALEYVSTKKNIVDKYLNHLKPFLTEKA